MSNQSEASLSNSVKTAVFFLIVLTIILLIGVFFFIASVSVFFQQDNTEVVNVVLPATATPTVQATGTLAPTLMPTHDLTTFNAPIEVETAVSTPPALPAPAIPTGEPNENQTDFGELIIQDIGVEQGIIPIFVQDGQWDISEIGGDIGHLETTGRFPGDNLAMTFTGHVTLPWPEIRGPFADLLFLEHGEEITYRWNGINYIYQVERIFRADPHSVHLLYEEDGDTLILVTCSGWDVNGREYAERLVTRAVLARQEPVTQNSE